MFLQCLHSLCWEHFSVFFFKDSSYVNDPDEEEQFLQHFAAATSRARHVNRSRRQTASRLDSSEVFPTVPLENGINLTYGLEGGLATTGAPASTIEVEASSAVPSVVDVTSMTPETGDGHVGHRYSWNCYSCMFLKLNLIEWLKGGTGPLCLLFFTLCSSMLHWEIICPTWNINKPWE